MRPTMLLLLLLLRVIPFAFLFVSSQTQTCPAIGIEAGVETINRSLDAEQDVNFLLNGKGVINCNGVIREWVFYSNDVCSSGAANIVFQVWKPSSPVSSAYELIGINTFSLADCISPTANIVTFGIAPVNRIPVLPGYTIGWYQNSNALQISYDNVTDANSFYLVNTASPAIGSIATFQTTSEFRDFSLKVTVIQGDPPTLNNLPSSVNVKEDVAPSTAVVFTVLASHINNVQYIDAVPLSFSLSPNSAPFTLTNVTNGQANVMITATLNYETLTIYQLSITVTGLGLSATEVLTVNVIDVNEPLAITNLPTTITVSAASTSAGDQMFSVRTSDPDVNPAFPVMFSIQSWTSASTNQDIPPFSINPDTGSVMASVSLSSWYLKHPTLGPAYPTSITYIITILATDGVYKDSQYLTITITNVKQTPVFLNLPGAPIQVDENIAGDTIIFQVLVAMTTDPNLLFQLTDVTTFCIDELSGDISLCSYAKLNYCKANQYKVNVTATNSVMSRSSLLTVDIRKISVAPNFTPAAYSWSVNEKCQPTGGTICASPVSVMSVTVTDPDLSCSPYVETLSCSVVAGPGSQFFDMTNNQTLRNIRSIDADSSPFYENIDLLIKAQDKSNLVTFATVHVSVINVNDHSPVFTQPSYNGSVQENVFGGTSVLSVAATDGDHGINGEFFYSIPASDPLFLFFQVDPQSGLISTKQPLDYENLTMPSPLSLIVWATDKGSPSSRSGSAVVTVNIIDVNDVRPVIQCSNRPQDEPYPSSPCFFNFDLKYDALIGQNVSDLLLSAEDVDPQQYVISFVQLVSEDHFSMDRSNGLLTVAKTVDAYKKYVLYVYAEDNGTPTLKSRIMYIRVDTYQPHRHWIDITVRPKTLPLDEDDFLAALRNVTHPWFMKIVAITNYNPNIQSKDIVLTVYALADDSTYFPENIANQKVFVPRGDLLKKLSKNIYGDPAEILRGPPFNGSWTVVKVTPSYVSWWLDTIEGIATIVCLSAIAVALVTAAAVAFCKWQQALCFKPSPSQPLVTGQGGTGASKPAPHNSSNQDNIRYRSARGRRDSVLTVHSAIQEESSGL